MRHHCSGHHQRSAGTAGAWLLACLLTAPAAADPPLKNWFNDPFFQASRGIAGCPPPRGPLVSEDEMRREAHYRAERGTSCWLAGECKRPNSYLYDADIGRDLLQRFAATHQFDDTSVWITVQRRFVFIDGCVARAEQSAALEAFARASPDVQYAVTNVMVGAKGRPTYTLAAP